MRMEALAAVLLIMTACQRDTTPPVITQMTGPQDGSTVNFDNFCFPIVISDNISRLPNLFVRTRFDSEQWTGWTDNMAPCFDLVADGHHYFAAQAKDAAGNTSTEELRRFIVDTH